jgi:SAM-dependent methyltransferase
MRRRLPTETTAETLEAYYRQTGEEGLYLALYWHSLIPDRYALHSVSALHHILQFAEGKRVFEYGHGVGSTAILFARHRMDVTAGDVSTGLRRFAEWRMEVRGLKAKFIDVGNWAPDPGSYDAMVSLDVLEHILDPLPIIRRMHAALRPGGVMVLNVVFGRDDSNPEHVLPWRTGVLNRIRAIGFERIRAPYLLVYYKRALGVPRKALYALQDTVDSLVEDLSAKIPGLWRLVRICSVPPLR